MAVMTVGSLRVDTKQDEHRVLAHRLDETIEDQVLVEEGCLTSSASLLLYVAVTVGSAVVRVARRVR